MTQHKFMYARNDNVMLRHQLPLAVYLIIKRFGNCEALIAQFYQLNVSSAGNPKRDVQSCGSVLDNWRWGQSDCTDKRKYLCEFSMSRYLI